MTTLPGYLVGSLYMSSTSPSTVNAAPATYVFIFTIATGLSATSATVSFTLPSQVGKSDIHIKIYVYIYFIFIWKHLNPRIITAFAQAPVCTELAPYAIASLPCNTSIVTSGASTVTVLTLFSIASVALSSGTIL